MTDSGQDHYFRLVTFVVEGCPKPLIKLFHVKAKTDPSPGVSFTVLGTYMQFHEPKIKQLKRRKIIRQDQYDLLFPSTGSVDETTWDISLVTSLLHNLFTLTPPEMGYIQDIRDVRNELCHISGTVEVSDAEFDNKWDKLEEAVIKLGAQCSHEVESEMKAYVTQLKHKALVPAEPIINKMKEWYTFETSTCINEIKENVIAEKKSINEIKENVIAEKNSINEIKETVIAEKKSINEIKENAIDEKKSINEIKENVRAEKKSISEIRENVIAEKKSINQLKYEVKQGNEIANAAKQIAVKSKDILKRASVVSFTRSGKRSKRIKIEDNALQKLKDHFKRTCKSQLPEDFIPDKEVEDIKTKLNENHRVVVSGSDKSTYISSALYAIKELNYNADRCVQITRAEDWCKVNYEDVDLVLCVDPFGSKRYNTKLAKDMATIFDYALEESNDQNAGTRISFVIATSAKSLKIFRRDDEHELLSDDVLIGVLSTSDIEDECEHDISDPVLKNLLAQSRLVIRRFSDDTCIFPNTQPAHEMFEENKHVIISGPRRSGKTTMAMRLLLPHAKDIGRCLVLNNPSDWKHVNIDYVNIVVIEDFCGKGSFNREMARKWLNIFDNIKACIDEGTMKVIITGCEKSLQQCWEENMGHDLIETSIQVKEAEDNLITKQYGPKRCTTSHFPVSQEHNDLLLDVSESSLFSYLDNNDLVKSDNVDVSLKTDTDRNVSDLKSNYNTAIVTSATMINQLNISLENDVNLCHVPGMLVVGDLIYIADNTNHKIKLFDMNGKYTYQLSVNQPRHMVDLNDSRIAVTHFKNTISIIAKEESTLHVHIVKTIQTSIPAYGISFYNGHLYVVCADVNDSCAVRQIQVLTLDGELKRRIEPIYQGSRVLQEPEYIAINQHTGTIYVTDWYKGVIALTSAGKVEFVQQAFSKTETAQGVALDENGHVYVCGVNTHNVMQISPDGKDVTEILKDECRYATAIAIQGHKLFLSCRDTDIIRVFKLT